MTKQISSPKIPTDDDLKKASEYALSKMCISIPEEHGIGLTYWDNNSKTCKITPKGCTPGPKNPLSQRLYDNQGKLKTFFESSEHPFHAFWKKSQPEFLVMKSTKFTNKLTCSRGTDELQNWCENPMTRGTSHQGGITDVTPFQYIIKNGKETCKIPAEYCKDKGVSYKNEDCVVPIGQQLGEFVTGTTLVRSARASDKRLKIKPTVYQKNYGGKGIHLYTYIWNHIGIQLYGNKGYDIGFIANDLEAADPKSVYVDKHGYKQINFKYFGSETIDMVKIVNFLKLKQQMYEYI